MSTPVSQPVATQIDPTLDLEKSVLSANLWPNLEPKSQQVLPSFPCHF